MSPSHDRRRWYALIVVCFAMLMNSLDQTIVNVALPTIQHDLHFTQANLAWVIDAYLLTFGGALLLAGRLGDLFGRRRVFLIGVLVFTAASAACGASTDQAMLIVARFVQGFGAALSSSVILAIIVAEFPEARERARAMSSYVFVAVCGGAVGLLLGGALTQALSWHWIFFINVPIGVVTLGLGWFLIDENVGLGLRAGLDVGGAVLSTAGMMVGIYAIVSASQDGWLTAHTLGFLGLAVVLLVAFGVLESRLRNPIIPLRILRCRGLVPTSFARGLTIMGMYSTLFIGVLYFQHILGYDSITTGLAYLPMTLAVMVMSLGVTSRLMRRFGPKWTAMAGFVLLLVGLLIFGQSGQHVAFVPRLLISSLMIGIGAAAALMPMLTIALAEVPAVDAGLGSGVINVAQQIAAALGVAILGTIADERTTTLLARGQSTASALTGGYHLAFAVAAGCVGLAIVVTAVFIHSPKVNRPAPVPDLAAEGEAVPMVTRATLDK
jgi:EmrB/QacA subfamily drug resistance transporter